MWLEGRGYVISPHTSAGRIPTNAGYRNFVNSLLLHPDTAQIQTFFGAVRSTQGQVRTTNPPGVRATNTRPLASEELAEDNRIIIDTLSFLSEYVNCLAVAWIPRINTTIYHRGLPALMIQPEFRQTTAALPLIQLLESQGDLLVILKDVQNTPGLHIRIGTEHEDSQLFAFSMVASRAKLGENTAVVALFGPTRMDYRKAIGALSAVINNWWG